MTDLLPALPEDPARVLAESGDPRAFVLVALDRAKLWLTTAGSVEDVAEVRAKAEAIRAYTVQANLGKDAEQAACEIRIRAERRIGELLKADPPRPGRPSKQSGTATISDHGISKDESSEFQKLAAIPEPEFDETVGRLRDDKALSRAAVLRKKTAEAEQLKQDLAEQKEWAEGLRSDDFDAQREKDRQQAGMLALGLVNAVKRIEGVFDTPTFVRLLIERSATNKTLLADLSDTAEFVAVLAESITEGASA